MKKFKVGDEVIVIEDLDEDLEYNNVGISTVMLNYRGRTAKITRVNSGVDWDSDSPVYKLDIDEDWNWTNDMLKSGKITDWRGEFE